MGDTYLQMGDAQTYLREQYSLKWSRPYIVKLVREGQLTAVQPGGERGWWYVSRESIDRLLKTT